MLSVKSLYTSSCLDDGLYLIRGFSLVAWTILNIVSSEGEHGINIKKEVMDKIKHRDKNIYRFFYTNLFGCEPLFLNLSKNDCYCCNSNTCQNIWSPAITINSIILEQLEIRFIESYCSELGYRYLSNIYNNLLNNILGKLPDEIIKTILKQC